MTDQQEPVESYEESKPGKPNLKRNRRIRLTVLLSILFGLIGIIVMFINMPGKSYKGPLPELTAEQRAVSEQMRHDLQILAEQIGERNVYHNTKLQEAERYLTDSLSSFGYKVNKQEYDSGPALARNIEAAVPGREKPDEIVVIGAHYDTVTGCPGANDNGTGCVALLALAQAFAGAKPERTLRFVFFVNEEPVFFQTEKMGSLVYARQCRASQENIVAMISLETIGYYSDKKGSQSYPLPALGLIYPREGNFIAFVSNPGSRALLKSSIASFRKVARFPSEGISIPEFVTGAGWSDHWSFWQAGYKGIMITDTAPFRYPHYHEAEDTIDKVDFDKMALIVTGIKGVVEDLAGIR